MAGGASGIPKGLRISVEVDLETRRRLQLAASRKDILVSQYVLEAVRERLQKDLEGEEELSGLLALSGKADPVLADLWDNEEDAAYDRL